MENENEILRIPFSFAVRIVRLCNYLKNEKKEYTLSRQLLRAGTSIGANVTEAQDAQSKKDFISKMSIALLVETDHLPKDHERVRSLGKELDSIIRLLSAINLGAKKALT